MKQLLFLLLIPSLLSAQSLTLKQKHVIVNKYLDFGKPMKNEFQGNGLNMFSIDTLGVLLTVYKKDTTYEITFQGKDQAFTLPHKDLYVATVRRLNKMVGVADKRYLRGKNQTIIN